MGDTENQGPKDWRETLPEDIRNDPSLKDFKDVVALAKSHIETKALVGQSLRVPSNDAGPDVRKAFLDKLKEKVPEMVLVPADPEQRKLVEGQMWDLLGKPKDAKGYTLEGVDLGGVQIDTDRLAESAARLGLTKSQFVAFAKGLAEEQQAKGKIIKGWQDAAKREWGAAYAERVGAIVEIAKKLKAPEATVKALEAGEVPPEQLAVWYQVTQMAGGGRQIGDQGSGTGKMTPAEARLKIEEIKANKVYWEKGLNPELHEALKSRLMELMLIEDPANAEPHPMT
jgi:hypothetical protein